MTDISSGNHWHSKVRTFLKQIASPEWSWASNSEFKYLNIRVDTRNGRFLIQDNKGRRVSLERVLYQYSKDTPHKPEETVYPEDYIEETETDAIT